MFPINIKLAKLSQHDIITLGKITPPGSPGPAIKPVPCDAGDRGWNRMPLHYPHYLN